jgi:SAM-dependent methyltransferase
MTSMNLLVALLVSTVLWGCSTFSPPQEAAKKPALDVPYEPTSYGIAREMLNMAGVTSKDLIYDLGCGDGRIVILAAKEREVRGIGVDLDPERIRESRESAKSAGVTHLVRFYEQNLFDTDISQATVVMLYLYPEVNLKLRPKLLKELKPGTRIVSHSHTMGDWEDDATQRVEGHDLHFFVVPANMTGTWRWDEPDGRRTSLSLTQKFQRVKGSMTIGAEAYPIMDCSLRGNTLLFSVERMGRGGMEVFSFEGQVSEDTIQGNITPRGPGRGMMRWQATRDPATTVSIAE